MHENAETCALETPEIKSKRRLPVAVPSKNLCRHYSSKQSREATDAY
jgi:hypothetical protein